MATGKILVHQDIAEDFAVRLADKAKRLRVGNPLDDGVAIGPIINARQLTNIHRILRRVWTRARLFSQVATTPDCFTSRYFSWEIIPFEVPAHWTTTIGPANSLLILVRYALSKGSHYVG
jgi:benzaldehyde dehydrogenase (NAD)